MERRCLSLSFSVVVHDNQQSLRTFVAKYPKQYRGYPPVQSDAKGPLINHVENYQEKSS